MNTIRKWLMGILVLAFTPVAMIIGVFWVMAVKLPIFAYEIWSEHRNDPR